VQTACSATLSIAIQIVKRRTLFAGSFAAYKIAFPKRVPSLRQRFH